MHDRNLQCKTSVSLPGIRQILKQDVKLVHVLLDRADGGRWGDQGGHLAAFILVWVRVNQVFSSTNLPSALWRRTNQRTYFFVVVVLRWWQH